MKITEAVVTGHVDGLAQVQPSPGVFEAVSGRPSRLCKSIPDQDDSDGQGRREESLHCHVVCPGKGRFLLIRLGLEAFHSLDRRIMPHPRAFVVVPTKLEGYSRAYP